MTTSNATWSGKETSARDTEDTEDACSYISRSQALHSQPSFRPRRGSFPPSGASDKITACGSPVEIDDVYRIVANIRVQIEIAARQPNRILTDEAR